MTPKASGGLGDRKSKADITDEAALSCTGGIASSTCPGMGGGTELASSSPHHFSRGAYRAEAVEGRMSWMPDQEEFEGGQGRKRSDALAG